MRSEAEISSRHGEHAGYKRSTGELHFHADCSDGAATYGYVIIMAAGGIKRKSLLPPAVPRRKTRYFTVELLRD